MIDLPISQIHLPPGTKVLAALLKSIREKGVLTPILVQQNGGDASIVRYKILDGRRRVAAAIQAGLEVIPAILLEEGGRKLPS